MENLLNAISLPIYLLISGFIASFFLYLFIQFLTKGISRISALFLVFLILFLPLILFGLSIKYLFTNDFSISEKKNHKTEEDSILIRMLIVILMIPSMIVLFFFRPANVANRIITETVNAIKKARETQLVEARETQLVQVTFSTGDEVALKEMLGGIFEKVILRGKNKARLIH